VLPRCASRGASSSAIHQLINAPHHAQLRERVQLRLCRKVKQPGNATSFSSEIPVRPSSHYFPGSQFQTSQGIRCSPAFSSHPVAQSYGSTRGSRRSHRRHCKRHRAGAAAPQSHSTSRRNAATVAAIAGGPRPRFLPRSRLARRTPA
jgi:hypothetical protein